MFAVVQKQELPSTLQVGREDFYIQAFALNVQSKGVHDRLGYQVLIRNRCEVYQPDPIAIIVEKLARNFYRKPRLTYPSGASKSDQPGTSQQVLDLADLAVPPHESRDLRRQVRAPRLRIDQPRSNVQARILIQDLLQELLKTGTRLHRQLIGQPPARPLIDVRSLCLTA